MGRAAESAVVPVVGGVAFVPVGGVATGVGGLLAGLS